MSRSSGVNLLTQANTWTQQQILAQTRVGGILIVQNAIEFTFYATRVAGATITSSEVLTYGDTTAGIMTITLPAAPLNGEIHFIKQINSANVLTIGGNGHNIDGVASLALGTQNEGVMLHFDSTGNVWRVVAQVATVIL